MVRKKKIGLLAPKRPKIECEICGEQDSEILHRHHIIPRTDPECTNDDMNLAVICPSCHSKHHDGRLEIYGVLPGTRPPTGRILVYEIDGKCNIPNFDPIEYFKAIRPKPKSERWFGAEEEDDEA